MYSYWFVKNKTLTEEKLVKSNPTMVVWKLFVNNLNCQDIYRSSLDKLKGFYTSLDNLNCCQSSIKQKNFSYYISGFMMSTANSLTEQNDRTCVSYRLYTNTIHCPEAFCISHKHSSFLFEIKVADWQNVGCATYLLSGHISKTSRNRCRKLTSSRSSTSTHYSCACATFLFIDLFLWVS